jgi:hypothetical protein
MGMILALVITASVAGCKGMTGGNTEERDVDGTLQSRSVTLEIPITPTRDTGVQDIDPQVSEPTRP